MSGRSWKGAILAALGASALCVGLGGCGGDPSSLSGRVTLNGEAVGDGTIRLDPIEGTPGDATVAPIRAGRYEMPRLQAGKHQVLILAARDTRGGSPPASPGNSIAGAKPKGPSTGDDLVRSDSVLELTPGQNTHNFELGEDFTVFRRGQ